MTKRKTHEEFLTEVEKVTNGDYVLLTNYVNNKTKVKIKHVDCGKEWDILPGNFIRLGNRCPSCATTWQKNKVHKKHEEFVSNVFKLVGDEYKVISNYEYSKVKLTVMHTACNNKYEVSPDNFLRGRRCPYCSATHTKTQKEFEATVYDKFGDDYTVVGRYINKYTTVKIKHNYCGSEVDVFPNNFLKGLGCPRCTGYYKRTHSEFVDEVYQLEGDNYKVVGEYKGRLEMVKLMHVTCGNVYDILPNNFIAGRRCPKCYHSKGEEKVQRFLDKIHVTYRKEETFDGLTGLGGGNLRFDFVILNKDRTTNCLIEYDGEGHYIEVSKFRNLETTQAHDKMKNKYCEDNNIPLLRIPYWEFDNIEKLVTEFLKEVKCIE